MQQQHSGLWGLLFIVILLSSCQSAVTAVAPLPTISPTLSPHPTISQSPNLAVSPPPISQSPNTPTPISTSTHTPTPSATPSPTATPTATPIGPCANRLLSDDDLSAVITRDYGLSRDYAPSDLVSLNDRLSSTVTLGYPIEVRDFVVEPLLELIADMQAVGLRPQLLSGYRSYSAQAFAYDKWANEFPGHVNIISAPPGHSEHQLGTTVDFGSPELPDYTGDPALQFHTYFYKTSEGIWLLENAHKYGFTLSYPLETFELTGMYYEPWHYRYVGLEMAASLHEMGVSLIQFQLTNQPEPCIPEDK